MNAGSKVGVQRLKNKGLSSSILWTACVPTLISRPDHHNKTIAFEKILSDVMLKRRKEELELYKLFAQDPSFKTACMQSIEKTLQSLGDVGATAR